MRHTIFFLSIFWLQVVVQGQTSFGLGGGYKYFQNTLDNPPIFTNYPYIPHVWLEARYELEYLYFGTTFFVNEDRFESEWPDLGTYTQIKKQKGVGIVIGANFPLNYKHYIGLQTSMGKNFQTWSLESDVDYLKQNLLPREEMKKGFIYLGLTHTYNFTEKLQLESRLGIGENNISFMFRRKICHLK